MKSSVYYAIYDVSDSAVRSNVARILRDAGLLRVQKSAFCGTLSGQQKKDLLEQVKAMLTDERDSFYLIAGCNKCFGKIDVVGKSLNLRQIKGKMETLVI